MKNFYFALLAVLTAASVSSAATMLQGEYSSMADALAGISSPTYIYDSATGEFSIDGGGTGIGLVDAQSASGAFSDNTVPAGLFPVDTANRISAVINPGSGTTVPNARLSNLGAGLTTTFLLDDLTLLWSGGFGTPNQDSSLAYIGDVVVDDLFDLPDGSTIDLQPAFDDRSGILAGILTANDGVNITGLSVTNNDGQEILGAAQNGNSIDGLIDLSLARFFAPGTPVSANLLVNTDQGDANFTLTAVVPEPATLGLFGLGLVGLVGLRRRS